MVQPTAPQRRGFFAAPHTPRSRPRFRPRVEALEGRTLLAVELLTNYNGLDFLSSGGAFPPDTAGAAGPTSFIETVNSTVGIFTPKAAPGPPVTDFLYHFFFVTGGLPHASPNSVLGDATMVWDDQVQRFIVADMDVDTAGHSAFPMAVSKSDSP